MGLAAGPFLLNRGSLQVDVPKFPKRIEYDTARINYIPRRRHVDVIQREIEAEYERMRAAPPAPPNRECLGVCHVWLWGRPSRARSGGENSCCARAPDA